MYLRMVMRRPQKFHGNPRRFGHVRCVLAVDVIDDVSIGNLARLSVFAQGLGILIRLFRTLIFFL